MYYSAISQMRSVLERVWVDGVPRSCGAYDIHALFRGLGLIVELALRAGEFYLHTGLLIKVRSTEADMTGPII